MAQRCPRAIVLGLKPPHYLFKRQVLMGIGSQCGRPDSLQYLPPQRITTQVRPEHHGIDDEPDQALCLLSRSIRHKGSDTEVFLACIVIQEYLEGSQAGHKERTAFLPAQIYKRLIQCAREFARLTCRAYVPSCLTGVIR